MNHGLTYLLPFYCLRVSILQECLFACRLVNHVCLRIIIRDFLSFEHSYTAVIGPVIKTCWLRALQWHAQCDLTFSWRLPHRARQQHLASLYNPVSAGCACPRPWLWLGARWYGARSRITSSHPTNSISKVPHIFISPFFILHSPLLRLTKILFHFLLPSLSSSYYSPNLIHLAPKGPTWTDNPDAITVLALFCRHSTQPAERQQPVVPQCPRHVLLSPGQLCCVLIGVLCGGEASDEDRACCDVDDAAASSIPCHPHSILGVCLGTSKAAWRAANE